MPKKPKYPFAALEFGKTREVAPDIFWLRMPLPFALNHINLWLLKDGDGWTLVDTGFNTNETRDFWTSYIEELLDGKEIKRIIVTHFHPDHVSLAGWLLKRFEASIWMTYSEWMQAQLNRFGGPTADIGARMTFYRSHGMTQNSANGYRAKRPDFAKIITPLPHHFVRIMDGDEIKINGDNWKVITGAGHSPEHAALWCEERNLLISGDQVLPRISTNVSVQSNEPEADPLGLYLSSLSKFKKVQEDALVLPSHDRPFYGLHDRIESLKEHHEDRLEAAYQACAQPTTGTEMIPTIFNRELDEHQLGFALGEALAHANRLVFEGRLSKELCDDGCIRYSQL